MEKKVIPCFWNPWVGVLWLWIKFLDGISLEATCPIAKRSFWQGHLGAFSSGTLFSFDTDCLFYYGHSGYTSSTQCCAVPQGCWAIGTWGEEDGEWRVEIVPVTSRCFSSWRLPVAVYVLLDWEACLLASFPVQAWSKASAWCVQWKCTLRRSYPTPAVPSNLHLLSVSFYVSNFSWFYFGVFLISWKGKLFEELPLCLPEKHKVEEWALATWSAQKALWQLNPVKALLQVGQDLS